MRNYEDLQVWQKAHKLTLAIGANIAEGCGRRSDPEMARCIQIAMGSGAELSYHLRLARDLGFLSHESFDSLRSSLNEIMRMLSSFSLRVKPKAQVVKLTAKS